MNSSVSISTLAVASSNTSSLFFFKIVLARQINCFCPTEKTLWAWLISVFIPCGNYSTNCFKFDYSIACQISSSEYSSNGSKFFLIVPANTKGVYGIREMLFLNIWIPTCPISTPSNTIFEFGIFWMSVSLKRAEIIEDLPAPVRPTRPTFSPLAILKFKLFNINSPSLLYFRKTFSNSNLPSFGQQLTY